MIIVLCSKVQNVNLSFQQELDVSYTQLTLTTNREV